MEDPEMHMNKWKKPVWKGICCIILNIDILEKGELRKQKIYSGY